MEKLARIERIFTALYIIWFFTHLVCFVYGGNGDIAQLWPFINEGDTLATTYDGTDFLIYTGTPLVIYAAFKIIFSRRSDNESYSGRRHSTATFFVSFLNEKIRAEELNQKINELTHQPVNYDKLNELIKDKENAETHGINGWLERMEVKKKYKEFQK
jgi:hypothetical protein